MKIDLLHRVAIQIARRRSDERCRRVQRHVRGGQRNVGEEPVGAMALDEIDGAVDKPDREGRLVRIELDNRVAIVQRQVGESLSEGKCAALPGIAGQFRAFPCCREARIFVGGDRHERMERPHVIRMRDTVKLVETVPHRQELVMVTEMPLAEYARRVSGRLGKLSEGDLVGMYSQRRTRRKVPAHARSRRIRTCHQHDARDAAAGRYVIVRERQALGGQPVDIGRRDIGRAIGADIPVAEVIGKDQYDVGLGRRLGDGDARREGQHQPGEKTPWAAAHGSNPTDLTSSHPGHPQH